MKRLAGCRGRVACEVEPCVFILYSAMGTFIGMSECLDIKSRHCVVERDKQIVGHRQTEFYAWR